MPKKTHASAAGPVTPVVDPLGGFQHDDYRLRAVESLHEAKKEIAKTHAGVWRVAILAVVLICAMVLGVSVPWELALSVLLGKAPVH